MEMTLNSTHENSRPAIRALADEELGEEELGEVVGGVVGGQAVGGGSNTPRTLFNQRQVNAYTAMLSWY
jgi:hypothetical protein